MAHCRFVVNFGAAFALNEPRSENASKING
jgi:hypothetical protein